MGAPHHERAMRVFESSPAHPAATQPAAEVAHLARVLVWKWRAENDEVARYKHVSGDGLDSVPRGVQVKVGAILLWHRKPIIPDNAVAHGRAEFFGVHLLRLLEEQHVQYVRPKLGDAPSHCQSEELLKDFELAHLGIRVLPVEPLMTDEEYGLLAHPWRPLMQEPRRLQLLMHAQLARHAEYVGDFDNPDGCEQLRTGRFRAASRATDQPLGASAH